MKILCRLQTQRHRAIIRRYKRTIHYHNALVIDDYEKSTGFAWDKEKWLVYYERYRRRSYTGLN